MIIEVSLDRKQGTLWIIFFESLRTLRHVSHGAKGFLWLGMHFAMLILRAIIMDVGGITYTNTLVSAAQAGPHFSRV